MCPCRSIASTNVGISAFMPRFENADKLPPSTMIGVTRLSNPEFLIEIDLMAIVEA